MEDGDNVNCPAGTQAISGGVRTDDVDRDGYITVSRPVQSVSGAPNTGEGFDGWLAFVYNQTDAQSGQTFNVNTLQATVWVVCIG
jgi:hypothetical protein